MYQRGISTFDWVLGSFVGSWFHHLFWILLNRANQNDNARKGPNETQANTRSKLNIFHWVLLFMINFYWLTGFNARFHWVLLVIDLLTDSVIDLEIQMSAVNEELPRGNTVHNIVWAQSFGARFSTKRFVQCYA